LVDVCTQVARPRRSPDPLLEKANRALHLSQPLDGWAIELCLQWTPATRRRAQRRRRHADRRLDNQAPGAAAAAAATAL